MTDSLLVVKIGGAEGLDSGAVCEDIASVVAQGRRVVVVHGGSAEASALGAALGRPPRWLTSPSGFRWRHTDRATLEIFAMATKGKVNTLLVERLQAAGVNALGLSGADGRLLVARRKGVVQSVEDGKRRVVRDDYTGRVEQVNVDLLHQLLAFGVTPVLAPLALSTENEVVNVDADRAAAMVAAALSAETLVLLTAAPGLLRRFPDESTLIPRLSRPELDEALALAQGGMKKKILGASEALDGGVPRVVIADGRTVHPLAAALEGCGTTIA
ncbi:MAG TPA: [LysW]-aminoadipate kinase [Anaerolineales bacterium]|nr:[LysW]-aminoadipate kinase [Anaerolineales bacterium]